MKAIILSRVSSKDQEEGYSIAAQTEKLKEYCQRKGLDVLKVFEITESSTVGDRKKFKEMLAYAKVARTKNPERIAIIVDAVDRLMRNFVEQPILNDLMNQDIIELHFARTGGIVHKDSTSTDKLFWNFQIMMAQSYVDVQRKLDRLLDLLIEQSITQSIYDKKVRELRLRQHEIEHLLSSHTKADETFHYTLSALVALTARAHECFARANIEQKRKLLTLLFANLEMQGTTLCYSLRKPFNTLAELPATEKWRAQQDSNLQPLA